MRNSVTLVKIFDIEIRVDLSWMLAFGMILWSLGSYYFPSAYPELSTLDVWTLAIAATTFLYVSITAHELGHSLVSARFGVPVNTITLFIFGGIAQLTREPRRARDDFFIALAGPIVSLMLALSFGALSWAGPDAVGLKLVAFGRWLTIVNLSLALFNLIPGFPLDGGRILRSILWGYTGNFQRSTRIAVRLGQAAALGLMGWGVLQFFDVKNANGLWIAFIGWFLYGAATSSLANLTFTEILDGLTAQDIMISDSTYVAPSWTLARFVHEMGSSTGQNFSVVVGNGRATGLIRMQEVKSISKAYWSSTTVGTIMQRFDKLYSVSPNEKAEDVVQQMAELNLAQMPVIEKGILMGMITHENIRRILTLRSEPKN